MSKSDAAFLFLLLLTSPMFCGALHNGIRGSQAKPSSSKSSTIGSWALVSKLVASDGRKNDQLGYSGAISGNTIVVGAPYATVGSNYAQGAAYVFTRPGSGGGHWSRKAKLTASGGKANAFFGSSVSISGDTIVVGADGVNLGSKQHAGAAYVFVKPAGDWASASQTATLTAADADSKAFFGSAVSVSGEVVAIAADGANVGSNQFQGAVYLFSKPAKGWVTSTAYTAKLTASDGAKGDQLGYSASINGDVVAAGARSAAVGPKSRQGAVYVFVRPPDGWASVKETAKLTASDGTAEDQFGYSVSINHDMVVAGAPGAHSAGSVYLFDKPASGWVTTSTFEARLSGTDGASGEQLGYSVAASDSAIIAGAHSATVGTNSKQGAVYIFDKPARGWSSGSQSSKLTASDGQANDGLGSSVSSSGDFILAGAVDATIGAKKYQGAAYLFSRSLTEDGGKSMPAACKK